MDSRIASDSSDAATGPIVPFAGEATSPDWACIHRDILCPLCDYNLRGLIVPRCPECGYQFDWAPLLNPTNNTHAYLFEHHPEKNVRSFIRTAIGTLKPRKFWSDLRADQAVRTRRLMAYWMICNLLPLILGIGWLIVNHATLEPRVAVWSFGSGSLPPVYPSSSYSYFFHSSWWRHDPTFVSVNFPFLDDYIVGTFLSACVANILFSMLFYIALIAFRASMRQARIRPEQVLRCVVYSTDAIVWIGMLLVIGWVVALAARLVAAPQDYAYAILENDFTAEAVSAIPYILALIACYRLSIAYSRYLRFRHPVATVLSVQFILLLIALVVRTFIYIKQMGG